MLVKEKSAVYYVNYTEHNMNTETLLYSNFVYSLNG